jgi:hypothetical protein
MAWAEEGTPEYDKIIAQMKNIQRNIQRKEEDLIGQQGSSLSPPPLSADDEFQGEPSDEIGSDELDSYNMGYIPPVKSELSVREKNISKKFSRTDRLGYGFTFMYDNTRKSPRWLTLNINPEEFTQSEPSRITVTQTKGGAFVDHFGTGLKTISLRGITGYHHRSVGGTKISGHDHFLILRQLIRDWEDAAKDNPEENHLYFFNWADEEYLAIVVTNFQLLRSVTRPLLYQYNIQFTAIRDVANPLTYFNFLDPTGEKLLDPAARAPLARDSLNKELKNVTDIVEGKKDISGMSPGTQEWSGYIAKGKTYYDTVSGAYSTVESLISNVDNFSKIIEMYVNGVTTFITKPFELVKDLTTSLEDVVHEMCAVANVPHELVRSFREMICAIRTFPESLFKGFSNPYLFEGSSNCGSSLGIPYASVSVFSNSFEVTKQIPADRNVSQVFSVPQLSLLLKEVPIQVKGVYLETDVTRSGNNYFESLAGKQVNLTSIPNSTVVVDYSVKQITNSENIIKLEAASAKILIEGVTLERLAEEAYNKPSRWKEIALYNYLEYPFIVERTFNKEIKATGKVRFYRRSGFLGTIDIPLGTEVYVPEYMGTKQINFFTTETKVLDLALVFVDISVEAVRAGDIGNVGTGRISGFAPISGIDRIFNTISTFGGKIWKVVKPGDIIMIPKTSSETVSVVVGSKSYEDLFGIDLAIDKYGELGYGQEAVKDFKMVVGTTNLVQALRNRINTEKRFYIYHIEYGSNLPYYIGRKNDPYWVNLVRQEVKSVCLRDPRISTVNNFSMVVQGDVIAIKLNAIPINEHTALPVTLIV